MRQLKISKSITSRESHALDRYLTEIGREDLLSLDDEIELSQRIRVGPLGSREPSFCGQCGKTIPKPRTAFARFDHRR